MCILVQPQMSLVRLSFVCRRIPRHTKRRLCRVPSYLGLLYRTLCYNYHTTWMITMETCLEPLFWFVDRFARYLGPIFVTMVVVLVTSVVTIFYVCLLPHVYHLSTAWTVFHMVFGHWLLMNIVFHYVMAVFTDPGTPPKQGVPEVVSICKKCISPKPPRSHHCTVCGRCILKMDHHCPWLNNCVGHGNHRYFYLFCVYMWVGTIYVSWVGHDLFRQHFYGELPTPFPPAFYPLNAVHYAIYDPKDKNEPAELIPNPNQYDYSVNYKEFYYHVAVLYEFILCSGVTLALGLMMLWHGRLISNGETTIEVHINTKEKKKFKKKNMRYKNPYNYGFFKNWQVFLGIADKKRSFWRHILFPSTHQPEGSGLTWSRAAYKFDTANGLRLL